MYMISIAAQLLGRQRTAPGWISLLVLQIWPRIHGWDLHRESSYCCYSAKWIQYQTVLWIHILTHRLVQFWDFIRVVSLYIEWWLTKKLTAGRRTNDYQRITHPHPHMGHLYHTLHPEGLGTVEKVCVCGGGGDGKSQSLERTGQTSWLLDTAEPLHSWIHISCDYLHKICAISSQSTFWYGERLGSCGLLLASEEKRASFFFFLTDQAPSKSTILQLKITYPGVWGSKNWFQWVPFLKRTWS